MPCYIGKISFLSKDGKIRFKNALMSFMVSILQLLFFPTSALQERLSLPIFLVRVCPSLERIQYIWQGREILRISEMALATVSSYEEMGFSKLRQTENRFLIFRTVWKIIHKTDKSTAFFNTLFFSKCSLSIN